MTSQQWQGGEWHHDLVVFIPKDAPPSSTWVLLITGGKGQDPKNVVIATLLAMRIKAPVAFLLNVPNQPLLDGREEDSLIAESLLRAWKTKDETMPILFPMVKSTVRAMDALQSWAGAVPELKKPEKFILAGFFKHGWLALLAAEMDSRVSGIIPVMTNMVRADMQLSQVVERWGKDCETSVSYQKRGLLEGENNADLSNLWRTVDPWTFRQKLTMPKLLLQATNDEGWDVESPNSYWDELPGPKWLMFLPNTRHDLMERREDGSKGDPLQVMNGMCAFARLLITNTPVPELSWTFQATAEGGSEMALVAGGQPKRALLWRTEARDRLGIGANSRWLPTPLELVKGRGTHVEARPASGNAGFYAAVEYEIDGIAYWLSTQARVIGAKP